MTESKRCFVIMPFGPSGTETHAYNLGIYQTLIKPVLQTCGYESIRADELEHVGNITRDIIELLHECDLVVADLSGRNPNVYYELGVRHVLFRAGTIPIIRKGEDLPFDIANYRAVFYSTESDGPEIFQRELLQKIRASERIQSRRADNPVHDVLGEKITVSDPRRIVPRDRYDEKEQQIEALQARVRELETTLAALPLGHNFFFGDTCKKCGLSRKAAEHFRWTCDAK